MFDSAFETSTVGSLITLLVENLVNLKPASNEKGIVWSVSYLNRKGYGLKDVEPFIQTLATTLII